MRKIVHVPNIVALILEKRHPVNPKHKFVKHFWAKLQKWQNNLIQKQEG